MFKRRFIYLFLAYISIGCGGSSNQSSELQNFPSLPFVGRGGETVAVEVDKFYASYRGFHDAIDEQVAEGRKLIDEARIIINEQTDEKQIQEAYEDCLTRSPEQSLECARASNIPPQAVEKLQQASTIFNDILLIYEYPELDPSEQVTAEDREKFEREFARFAERAKRLETIFDKACRGRMQRLERWICEESLLVSSLYDLADTKLNDFVTAVNSCGSNCSGVTKLYEEHLRYNAQATEVAQRFLSYRTLALTELNSINKGLFNAVEIQTVPYLAVVGDPEKFLGILKGYIDKFADYAEKAVNTQKELIRVTDEDLSLADTRRRLEESRIITANDYLSYDLQDQEFQQDNEYLTKKVQKINEQAIRNRQRFSLEFAKTVGSGGTTTGFIPQAGQTNINVSVFPNDQKEAVIDINPNFVGGALQITAAAVEYRSNGIYSGAASSNQRCCKIKVKKPKFVEKVQKKGSNLNERFSKSLKGVNAKAAIQAISTGGAKFMGEANKVAAGGLVGIGVLGNAVLSPVGRLVDSTLEASRGMLSILGAGFGGAFEPILPGVDIGGRLSKSKTPNALELLSQIDNSALKTPSLEENVLNELTTPNGYIISKNTSKSFGINVGTNSSVSVGTNRSVSVGVSAAPIGVGPTGGLSFGSSSGTSQGDSQGASVGTSAGLSSRVGFFHRNADLRWRVGMLLAELQCVRADGSVGVLNTFGVGASNFISIPATTASCPRYRVRLFTNDNAIGKKSRDCRRPNGALQACASADPIPVTYSLYLDQRQTFKKLLNIFESESFQQVIEDSAYSADPYGTAVRLFEQSARDVGLGDNVILEKMQDVVRQFVTFKLDEKELTKIALDTTKAELGMQRVALGKTASLVKKQIAEELLQSNASQADLKNVYLGLLGNQADFNESLSNLYLDRISFWADVYRQSMRYHNNDENVKDLGEQIRQFMQRFAAARLNGQRLPEEEQFVQAGAEVATLKLALTVALQDFYEGAKTLQTINKIIGQETPGHCSIDLRKSTPLGRGDQGAVLDSPSPLIQGGFKLEDFVPRPARACSNAAKQEKFSLGFDCELARAMLNGTSIADMDRLEGYYRINLNTSIAENRVNLPAEELGQLPNASLKCQRFNRSSIGMAKIFGVAITYQSGAEDTSLGQILVERDPLMEFYVNNNFQDPIYRLMDTTDLTLLGIDGVTRPHAVRMSRDDDVFGTCNTTTGVPSYEKPECIQELLGFSIFNGEAGFILDSYRVNFLNASLGGNWILYIPKFRDGTSSVTNQMTDAKIHFFFHTKESVF